MVPLGVPKTSFISNHGNYYYNIMPFGLKNADVTYQRLVDAIFAHQIRRYLKAYIDDMLINKEEEQCHVDDL